MNYRMIKDLSVLILVVPILAWSGEEISQRVRQKYGLPVHKDETSISSKMAGIGIHSKIGGDTSSIVVYTYELGSDFETAKEDLERKGVNFIGEDDGRPAAHPRKKTSSIDPVDIPDYRVSVGGDEEKFQVILSSHQFDGSQGKWVKRTTVRIIVPVPSASISSPSILNDTPDLQESPKGFVPTRKVGPRTPVSPKQSTGKKPSSPPASKTTSKPAAK